MASIREQILEYGLGIAVVSPSATHYRYLNLLSLNDCLRESIALLSRGHEVLVSTPESGGAIVREAGLAHALSGFSDEEDLREIWDSLPRMSPQKAEETVLTYPEPCVAGRALPCQQSRNKAILMSKIYKTCRKIYFSRTFCRKSPR